MSRAFRAIAVLPFLIAATLAVAQTQTNGPATVIVTPFGRILAGPDGHTLYAYDGDVGGIPACYGDCAVFWPPFLAQEGAVPVGDWTIVPRTDGPPMWAYRGKPLYYWHADNIPGQTYGRGMDGVWHIVPAGDPSDGGMDAYGMGM